MTRRCVCATFLILMTFSPVFSSGQATPQASAQRSTQDGLLLLHKMQEGLGGAKSIAVVRDLDETIRAEAWEFARSYLSGFELELWLADQVPGYTVTSSKSNAVRIEHEGRATDFMLDPVTKLPLSSASVSLADPDRPVPAEMRYDGWREISGVRFPTHRVNYHSGVKRGEVTTEAILVNVGLRPRDLAAKPAGFAPDIPRR